MWGIFRMGPPLPFVLVITQGAASGDEPFVEKAHSKRNCPARHVTRTVFGVDLGTQDPAEPDACRQWGCGMFTGHVAISQCGVALETIETSLTQTIQDVLEGSGVAGGLIRLEQ